MEETVRGNIIIENRSRLTATGVIDVDSFDNESAILLTELGALFVKGSNFRINKLNVDIGELIIEGEIDSCIYSESYAHKKQGSFISRMFK